MRKKGDITLEKFIICLLLLICCIMLLIAGLNKMSAYNPEKHTCVDYKCGYMNPYGKNAPEFSISQIVNTTYKSFENWTDRTRCPKTSGTFCYEGQCIQRPLMIEECSKWIPKEGDE